MVGVEGLEPPTPWSQTRCANRTALHSGKEQCNYRKFSFPCQGEGTATKVGGVAKPPKV